MLESITSVYLTGLCNIVNICFINALHVEHAYYLEYIVGMYINKA